LKKKIFSKNKVELGMNYLRILRILKKDNVLVIHNVNK